MAGTYSTANDFTKLLRAKFERVADTSRAAQMSAYMKGRFPFFGLQQAERRKLFKLFLQENGLPSNEEYEGFCQALYREEEREFHYCAIDLAGKHIKNNPSVELYLHLIRNKSWWDSVDSVNSVLLMPYFTKHPEQVGELSLNWARDQNIWMKRVSIICQLKSKGNTQMDILFRNIQLNLYSKEFFVQKAIGWALRELSKTQAQVVEDFVNAHQLASLSKREAMRIILKSRT